VDVSTGEFYVCQITGETAEAKLMDELSRVKPREILLNQGAELDRHLLNALKERCSPFVNLYHEWAYGYNTAYQKLIQHFSVHSLEGYGCQHMNYGICAAGALLEYLAETQKKALTHITRLKSYHIESYMVLDASTRLNRTALFVLCPGYPENLVRFPPGNPLLYRW